MDRRRYLLAMVNMYKYLPYYWQYLFYGLVPETVAGFNKWDEEWLNGYWNIATGNFVSNSSYVASKNPIPVFPNTTYYFFFNKSFSSIYANILFFNGTTYLGYTVVDYDREWKFTTPSNCNVVKFYCNDTYGSTYTNDICINENDPAKNGTYQPYHAYKVKNKARIKTIYGNSEVENQLCELIASRTEHGVTATNNGDGSITLHGTCDQTFDLTIMQVKSLIQGHIYLVRTTQGSSGVLNTLFPYMTSASSYNDTFIFTASTTANTGLTISLYNTKQYDVTFYPQVIDLSQMFPFDTPTTLTDNRVQNIINRGYIPFNTGEIKSVDIGLFSSECFNIWDEVVKVGYYLDGTTGQEVSNASSMVSQNYCECLQGNTYYLYNGSGYNVPIYFYDKNKKYISRTYVVNNTFTTPTNTYYFRLSFPNDYGTTYNHDICINVSSSMNGTYKPHNSFQTLPHFNPNKTGTVENTFLQTNTANNFTKRVGVYVFTGNETATFVDNTSPAYGNHYCLSVELPTAISSIIATNYDTLQAKFSHTYKYEYANNDKSAYVNWNITRINFINDSATTEQQAREILAGLVMDFELATYQNISMPLRHLGMVDLGSLEWNYQSSETYPRFLTTGINSIAKPTANNNAIGNIYCNNYQTTYLIDITTNGKSQVIAINNAGNISICDTNFTDPTEFKNSLQGQYLYFETTDVTADIVVKNNILSFKYQGGGVGTSHDKMERTDTEWVFTKEMFDYVFNGNESWFWTDNAKRWAVANLLSEQKQATTLSSSSTQNALIGKQLSVDWTNDTYGTGHNGWQINGRNFFYHDETNYGDSSHSPASLFPSGTVLTHNLATPQVTRIPRKHLAVVDLSKCTFTRINANRVETTISDIKPVANDKVVNVYCTKGYIANSYNNTANENVACVNNSTTITFYKTGGFTNTSTSAQIQELFTNIYMFYETQDEVADIDYDIGVEAGGTLTANWFSWVRNQLAQPLNSTYWYINTGTLDVNDNVITYTNTAKNSYAGFELRSAYVPTIISGHKYLVFATLKSSNASGKLGYFILANVSSGNNRFTLTSGYSTFASILEPTGNLTYPFRLAFDFSDNTGYMVDVLDGASLVDLTLGFGAGKEPTDINDPRIQEIIRLGYIPTDTTGTYEEVDCEVLPNVDVELKAK